MFGVYLYSILATLPLQVPLVLDPGFDQRHIASKLTTPCMCSDAWGGRRHDQNKYTKGDRQPKTTFRN